MLCTCRVLEHTRINTSFNNFKLFNFPRQKQCHITDITIITMRLLLYKAMSIHTTLMAKKRDQHGLYRWCMLLGSYIKGRRGSLLHCPAIIQCSLTENSRLESSVNLSIYRATATKQNGAICVCSIVDFVSIQLRYLLFSLLRSSRRHL